ncbi:FK506-binding nuclear protein, partial [Trichonephila clavipes]
VCCESGKKYSQVVKQKFHISMAALDASVVPTSPCISLMVERGGSEYLLCNLKPDSLLQVNLNLYFDKGEKIAFFLKGHGTVHLSGYLIHGGNENFKDSGGIGRSEQNQVTISLTKDKKVKTGNVKTNEMYEAKESKKAETATPTKKLFFSPEEKVVDFLKDSADKFENSEEKSVEAETATPTKKLFFSPEEKIVDFLKDGADKFENSEEKSVEEKKGADPKKSAVGKISKAAAMDEESSEEEEEEEDSSEDDFEDIKTLRQLAQKRPRAQDEEDSDDEEDDDDYDEEEEDDDDDEEDIEVHKIKTAKGVQNKKFKTDSSTPIQAKKGQTILKKSTEVVDLEDDASEPDDMNLSIEKTPMPKKQASSIFGKSPLNVSKKDDMNSSVGRTPMPKKQASVLGKDLLNESKKKKPSEAKESDSESDDNDDEDMDTSASKLTNKSISSPNISSETPSSKKKKKKAKKLAASANESNLSQEGGLHSCLVREHEVERGKRIDAPQSSPQNYIESRAVNQPGQS